MDHQLNRHRERQILRLPAVMSRTGMGRSWIYREMAAGRFVQCIKIGRASGWDSAAIDQWVEARVATREPAPE